MHKAGIESTAIVCLAIGGIIGFYLGRWRQAIKYWRSTGRKVRRDWRDVRRGPRL